MDNLDEENRALAAYFRTAGARGEIVQQPAMGDSGLETYGGKDYVVLRNVNGLLAVYRVRNDGSLKRLKRIPAAIPESL